MKRMLVFGLVAVVIGSLVAGFVIPAFAHGPEGGESAPADEGAWEAMHEACEDGDWEAMDEAAEEVHGEDFDDMPCHSEGYYDAEGKNSGSTFRRDGMGGGMMGGGWSGMM